MVIRLWQVRQSCSNQGQEMISKCQFMMVECTDANKNTPLSEAAAGGDLDTIRFAFHAWVLNHLL